MIVVLNSQFYFPGIKPDMGEPPVIYTEFVHREDNRGFVCKVIHQLVNSNDERLAKLGFTAINHIHYSLISVLIDVLAVAEADMSADHYICVESVFLGVGEQRERIQGLCTLTRRRRGLLQGFGRSEEIERESQWLPAFAAYP